MRSPLCAAVGYEDFRLRTSISAPPDSQVRVTSCPPTDLARARIARKPSPVPAVSLPAPAKPQPSSETRRSRSSRREPSRTVTLLAPPWRTALAMASRAMRTSSVRSCSVRSVSTPPSTVTVTFTP